MVCRIRVYYVRSGILPACMVVLYLMFCYATDRVGIQLQSCFLSQRSRP